MATPDEKRTTNQRLDDPAERDALWQAIIEFHSVNRACQILGLARCQIYFRAHKDEVFAAELLAAEAANMRQLIDECIELSDNMDGQDWGKARLQIETRMRLAGKLIPKIYGEQPAQNNINVGVQVGVICDEEQRKKLISMREQLVLKQQGGAAAARLAHNQKAEGSSPSPAIIEVHSERVIESSNPVEPTDTTKDTEP